jgi:beta-galactosidase
MFGGDYFPEQWPREVWDDDIRLMKEANVNMVSVAIFAWALLQPDEDTFTFGWLDDVMDLMAENGIDVCLGTSTAATPNWLSKKYADDILFERENGERVTWGSRQTFCINSPVYREAACRLTEEIAKRYKGHPALKLWHINNEYGNKNSMCFCKNCEAGFREWLKKKYGTIEKLNEEWGTFFWSEHYGSWDEVNTPQKSAGGRNATKLIDYKRFLSASFFSLYKEEKNVVAKITPDIPITTNFEGAWNKFDHALFKDDMDIVSWNCYPDPGDMQGSRNWAAMRHAMCRSLLGKPFMLMEQAPSQVDWYPVNIAKRPGVMRLWSFQAIAHGSDSVMYFQWRASKKGAEKYHSGMVPHYGEDSRVFKDIKALGSELHKIQDVVGSMVEPDVAILMDNDAWWSVDDPYSNGAKSLDNEVFWSANAQQFPTVLVSYFGELEHWFNAFYDLNVPVDIIPATYDFSKYKVVVAPLMHMLKPGFAEAVEKYVREGGTFITTYFTGLIDENIGVFLDGYLGPLKNVLGLKVEEYDPMPPGGTTTMTMEAGQDGFKDSYECSVWAEVTHTDTAETLARFSEDYYAGHASLTKNRFGEGDAYYVATRPGGTFMKDFLSGLMKEKEIEMSELPADVERVTRAKDGTAYDFYLNHGTEPKTVTLPAGSCEDLLSGKVYEGTLELEPFGVAVLKN